MKFNTVVSVLNFMSEKGYEYVDALSISGIGGPNYHFYMRKKREDQQSVTE